MMEMNNEFKSAMTKMTEALQSGKTPLDVQDALQQAKEQEAAATTSSEPVDVPALE